MEGEQLPKATMNAFIKAKTTCSFSADYLAKVLYLAKEFVVRVSDKANDRCENANKKTISADHLEAALTEFGLTDHLNDLKNLEDALKEQNQLKREASQRMEELLAKDLEEQRARRRQQQLQTKKHVTERKRFEELEKADAKGEQEDYENIVDLQADNGEMKND